MHIDDSDLARLRSQATRGELILFTGAGFSVGAKNHSGQPVPSSSELKGGWPGNRSKGKTAALSDVASYVEGAPGS